VSCDGLRGGSEGLGNPFDVRSWNRTQTDSHPAVERNEVDMLVRTGFGDRHWVIALVPGKEPIMAWVDGDTVFLARLEEAFSSLEE
tara:strand:- start:49 stop:306 length:258 start_codon:yes stop_codon:yes gene_type:complete